MTSPAFADFAQAYRDAGYYPRPVAPGTKAPPIKGWNKPDPELADRYCDDWIKRYGDHGIGLVTGSVFPDGTALAVIDIDRDDYQRVTSVLLGHPACGRIGKKGIAYFVRLLGVPPSKKFNVTTTKGTTTAIGDLLFGGAFCVIPPTVHPETEHPYRWVGKPLLEVPFHDLPLVEV